METQKQKERRERAVREAAYKNMLRARSRNYLVDRIIELENQIADSKRMHERR